MKKSNLTGHSSGSRGRAPGQTSAPGLLALIVLIAVSGLVLGGCSVIERFTGEDSAAEGGIATEAPASAPAPEQDAQVFAVNVTPAVQGGIRNYIEVNGDVQTTTSVDIFSNTAGEVARVHVRLGERVEADQLIAEVDASRPGQTFAPSPVRSPIAGTVTRLPARVGSQVTPAVAIAQVSRTTELEIVVPIAERFISKVRTGLNAEVRLDAFPDQRFAARITDLNPVVDPQTRTLEVKLRFNRSDPRIRAGMFAEVRIITEQKENIVKIPADVVIRRFGETFVFVVRENAAATGEPGEPDEPGEPRTATVERRLITPGILIDNTLEVVAGLQPDETVVYQGQALLEDGVAVRVINRFNVLETGDTP